VGLTAYPFSQDSSPVESGAPAMSGALALLFLFFSR